MKKYLLSLLLLTTLGAHSRPQGGADGGGGGNTRSIVMTSRESLESIFELPQQIILPFLFFQEEESVIQEDVLTPDRIEHIAKYSSINPVDLRKAMALLYPMNGGKNVYDELKEVEFKLKAHGPCNDTRFNHRDASAFNADPREICISAERLMANVAAEDLVRELAALMGHELVHRMGGGEPEAEAFQDYIREHSVSGSPSRFLSGRIFGSRFTVEQIRDGLNKLNVEMAKRAHSDPLAICMALTRLSSHVDDLLESRDWGVSSLRPHASRDLRAAHFQIFQMLNYCHKEPQIQSQLRRDVEIVRPTYLRDAFFHSFDLRNGLIQRGEYLNFRVLQLNYSQMVPNVLRALQSYDMYVNDWIKRQ